MLMGSRWPFPTKDHTPKRRTLESVIRRLVKSHYCLATRFLDP